MSFLKIGRPERRAEPRPPASTDKKKMEKLSKVAKLIETVRRCSPDLSEGPGETFTKVKHLVFIPLLAALSAGTVALTIYLFGWIGVLFIPIYLVSIWLGWILVRYSGHGNPWLSYPLIVIEWLMVVVLAVTFFGQMAFEAQYRAKQLEQDDYQVAMTRYRADLDTYKKDLETRRQEKEKDDKRRAEEEQREFEREKIRLEREKVQLESDREATRRTAFNLQIARLAKQTQRQVVVAPAPIERQRTAEPQQSVRTEADIEPPLPAPVEPKRPEQTPAQLLLAWQFKLKLSNFADLGVGLFGLLLLTLISKIVNGWSWEETIDEESRRYLKYIINDWETIRRIPGWIAAVSALVDQPEEKKVRAEDSEGNSDLSPEPIGLLEASPSLPESDQKTEVEPPISDLGDGEGGADLGQFPAVLDCPKTGEDCPSAVLTENQDSGRLSCATIEPEKEPEPRERKATFICNNRFKLVPRSPAGWRIRAGDDPGVTHLGSLTEAEAISVLEAPDQDRLTVLNEIRAKRGQEPFPTVLIEFNRKEACGE